MQCLNPPEVGVGSSDAKDGATKQIGTLLDNARTCRSTCEERRRGAGEIRDRACRGYLIYWVWVVISEKKIGKADLVSHYVIHRA